MDRKVDSGIENQSGAAKRTNGFVNRWPGFRLPPPALDSEYLQNLAKKLDILADRTGGKTACHIWAGGRDKDGYGRLYSGNQDLAAHRSALEVKIGRRLLSGELALHSCDNPPCVNPEHLSVGDHLANNQDCVAKGRHVFGERSPEAKLTEEQAREILREVVPYRRGIYTALAKRFGVSSRLVAYIATGRRWAHLAADGGAR
jgi:hypothetical protein